MLTLGQDQRAAHHVFQFADIAGPAVQAQHGQRVVRQPRQRLGGGGVAQHHGKGERSNVFGPFAQGPQRQGEDVEPVEQIGAEPALGNFGRQIAVSAGNDPHVDLDRLSRADRHHLTLLQRAEQLGLKRQRHLGDFIEQQSAAIGSAEKTFVGLACSGEGALAVAEQQRLEHGLGHRRAIDRDKRSGGAGAARMDEAAQDFLAGAGRSADQHGDLADRKPISQREHRQCFGIGGNRHPRRGECGKQGGECGVAGRVGVSECKRTFRAIAAQQVAGCAFEADAGAGARRGQLSSAAQRWNGAAKPRSDYRRSALDQRCVPPLYAFAWHPCSHNSAPD